MQIVQSIILDLLKRFDAKAFLSEEKTFHFQKIQLLDPGSPPAPQENILYLGSFAQVLHLSQAILHKVCIVCIGEEEEIRAFAAGRPSNLIAIPPQYALATVANELYAGFERLQSWSRDLETAILTRQDYQVLVSICARFFGENPIIMINSSYTVLAASMPSVPSHKGIDEILRCGYYPKDVTDGFARMGYQAKGPHAFVTPTFKHSPSYMECPYMVLASHADNGIFLGLITVYFTADDPTDTHFALFSYFAPKLRQYYLDRNHENTLSPTPLEEFIADLVNHTRKDETFLMDRARSLRLPLSATYRLCVIYFEEFILPQAVYMMNRLKGCLRFPFFRVLLYHNSVLMLLHGDISSLRVIDEIHESLEEFREILRISKGYAGFSTASFPLLKLDIAYKQALAAVRYGMLLSPEKGFYFYSHYYIYEMIDDYKNRYELEDMYVKKLRQLENPSEKCYDNLALLRNYLLTERSISVTAKIMHMHRNSVIYRLNKIQDILGLDLDNPDVRLRLLISFKVLELQAGHTLPVPVTATQDGGPVSFFE